MTDYPTKCRECDAQMLLASSGLVCPSGHGKTIPVSGEWRKAHQNLFIGPVILGDDGLPVCDECDGEGVTDCPECDGSGWSECWECGSETLCRECDGSGEIFCDCVHGQEKEREHNKQRGVKA